MLTFLLKIFIFVGAYLGQSCIFAAECHKEPVELEEILIDVKNKNCKIHIERKRSDKGTSFTVEASPPISHQSCYSLANRLDQIVQDFAKAEGDSSNAQILLKAQNANKKPATTSTTYKLFKFFGYSTITAISIGAAAWLTLNWTKLGIADQVTSYIIKMNICSYVLPDITPPLIVNPVPPTHLPFFCSYNIFPPFFNYFGCPI